MPKQLTPAERDALAKQKIDAATSVITGIPYGKPGHEQAVKDMVAAVPDILDPLERMQAARTAGRFSAPMSPLFQPSASYVGLQVQATQHWSEAIRAMAAHPQHAARVEHEIIRTVNMTHQGSLLLDTATKTDGKQLIANATARRPPQVGPGRAGSRPGAHP